MLPRPNRALMDGLGSLPHCEAIAEQIAARGVQARVYHPPPWMFGSYRLTRRPHGILLKFFVLLWNINRRDHRKLCTVDRERAWVGSFNISAQHLPQSAGGRAWRDYALELTGPRVESLAEGFDELWEGHTPQLQRGFLAGFLSNRSIKARQIRNRHVARSVASARRRVWLVMAYFLPTAGLRRALLNACREGCDVLEAATL